ncbi:hypothetical protein DPMN_127454 [Dreissena polymorpha]|uniref:Uncharacterized protein n=1 Tax=Dreissena polymorpha TaxID=45954 RepID=A0A9D4JWI2_DREPO|nr:hypothetical protein DPMN_127454 [Dreissena polymorpha]
MYQGLHVIEKYVSGRRISMTRQDVVTILSCENPFIYKLSPSTQDSVHTIGTVTACP